MTIIAGYSLTDAARWMPGSDVQFIEEFARLRKFETSPSDFRCVRTPDR